MKRLVLLWLLLAWLPGPRWAAQTGGAAQKPRLVVLLSIDQFAAWVLNEAWPFLGPDGFRRLKREGVSFEACAYRHAVTFTGPGHATLGTGATAALHGIVGNSWFDRLSGKHVYCVDDPKTESVGGGPPMSPRNLLAPTLGDTMKAFLGKQSKVVSLSWKDRAAILMGGHGADLAAWMNKKSGRFVSSTWYGKVLPGWLLTFNKSGAVDSYFGRSWARGGPAAAYLGRVDDRPFERADNHGKRTLPHVIDGGQKQPGRRYYTELYGSPFGNDLLLDAVAAALKGAGLGEDATPDLLCVSLSANDVVGHLFGPRSVEVQDMTLRTDGQVARLLGMLDHKVGQGNYLLMVSADHGMAPAPAGLKSLRGLAAQLPVALLARRQAELALVKRYGQAPEGRSYVRAHSARDLYLDHALLKEKHIHLTQAQDAAAAAAALAPGVAVAVAARRLLRNQVPQDPIHRAMLASINPARSGDVLLAQKPFWITPGIPASHGSPYSHDQQVPFLIMGPGIRPGQRSFRPVTPGIGVVLAAYLLGIPKPALAVDDLPGEVVQ